MTKKKKNNPPYKVGNDKNSTKVMFEPFNKKHAELMAEDFCELMLGLDKYDPAYESEYKKAFKKFFEEALYESMTPGRMQNPTTAKITKDVTGIYYLTDPNLFAKEMLPNSSSQEQQFLSSQVRGAIMSLVNALLKTKFDKVFGDRDEPFTFKNIADKEASKEDMAQVVMNRYFRIALFSMMVAHLEKFFTDALVAPNFIANTLDQCFKELNMYDSKGDLKLNALRNKSNRQKISNVFYNLIFQGRVKIKGE